MARRGPGPRARAHLAFEGPGYQPPNGTVCWRYVWCGGYDDVEIASEDGTVTRKRVFHHFENKPCKCPPGPQVLALWSDAFETVLCGGRGGLKTESGLAFSVKGNPGLTQADPVNISYINCPHYRFLVLRKNAKDLDDWFRRARAFYGPLGATFTENPMKVKFPTGAEGVLDHMQDDYAYEKYQGQEFQRIILEELTQIPSETLYLKIIMSCRSTIPGLKQQVLVTANPGGPGHTWFKKRFVGLKDENGNPLKRGVPYVDPIGLKRLCIHSTVYDNPYFLRNNAAYVQQLEMLPPLERKRWLEGDFDAVEGQYFEDWRNELQSSDKCGWAFHVIPAGAMEWLPYWYRWMSMDWGYSHSSSVYWHCNNQADGRVYTYRELVRQGTGSFEMGIEIARASVKDLEGLPDHRMTLYLSPDAFARKDAVNSPAQLIQAGMEAVLGPGSAFLEDYSDDEFTIKASDPVRARLLMEARRREFGSRASINIARANNDRVAGWDYMRELLRWRAVKPDAQPFNAELARQIFDQYGIAAYDAHLKTFEIQDKPEVLPKWRITDKCKQLIEALPAAQRDPKRLEDVLKNETVLDDCIDAARYGMAAHKDLKIAIPKPYFVQERIESARELGISDMTVLSQVARRANQAFEEEAAASGGSMRLGRASRRVQ